MFDRVIADADLDPPAPTPKRLFDLVFSAIMLVLLTPLYEMALPTLLLGSAFLVDPTMDEVQRRLARHQYKLAPFLQKNVRRAQERGIAAARRDAAQRLARACRGGPAQGAGKLC